MSTTLQRLFSKVIPYDIIPIRVNFLQARDFEKARRVASEAAAAAFNEGCLLSRKLKALADAIDEGFAPNPNECRAASYFDAIITGHQRAMKKQAEIILGAATAFVEQCNALDALATVLMQSDHGTEGDAVKKLRCINLDGTGTIIELRKKAAAGGETE